MGPHYWIKQIIELMLATATPDSQMTNCTPPSHLPAITAVISMADAIARDSFNDALNIKIEPADISIMDMGQNGVVGEDAELAEIEQPDWYALRPVEQFRHVESTPMCKTNLTKYRRLRS